MQKPVKSAKSPIKSSKRGLSGRGFRINRWMVLGFVALVAVVGVSIVRYSGASGTTFVRTGDTLSYLTGGPSQLSGSGFSSTKVDGKVYKKLNNSVSRGVLQTLATVEDLRYANKVCAHFRVFKYADFINIEQIGADGEQKSYGSAETIDSHTGVPVTTGDVCTRGIYKGASSIRVLMSNRNGDVGVDMIYGLK